MSLTHATDRLEVIHDDIENSHSVARDQRPDSADGSGTQSAGASASEPTGTRPTFTITDAAAACSVSRKTITRKLPELAGHGAAKDDDGVWRIPVEALLAVGLHPGRSLQGAAAPAPKRPAPSPTPARVVERDTVTVSRDRWDDLRIRLARAEAEASERALALADARLALRALTAGPGHGSAGAGTAPGGITSPRTLGPAPDVEAPVPPVLAGPAPARVTPMPAGQGQTSAAPASPGTVNPGPANPVAPSSAAEAEPDEVVAARNLAARTGGYVPAAPAPAKKRRWWHSA
jgi:hypothetical protein